MNIHAEYRWADGQLDRLPNLAAGLVRRNVAVIVTTGGPLPSRTALDATSTIRIVFATGSDPIERGLVPRLTGSRVNVTGVTQRPGSETAGSYERVAPRRSCFRHADAFKEPEARS